MPWPSLPARQWRSHRPPRRSGYGAILAGRNSYPTDVERADPVAPHRTSGHSRAGCGSGGPARHCGGAGAANDPEDAIGHTPPEQRTVADLLRRPGGFPGADVVQQSARNSAWVTCRASHLLMRSRLQGARRAHDQDLRASRSSDTGTVAKLIAASPIPYGRTRVPA